MESEPFATVYINSQYVSGGTTSAFNVGVRGGPLNPTNGRVTKVAITSAMIPLTYFGVNSTNNIMNMWELQNWPAGCTFNVTETPISGSPLTFAVSLTNVLPANIGLFTNVISLALTSASASGGYGATYTVVLNSDFSLTYEFANGLTALSHSSWDLSASTAGPGLGFGSSMTVTLTEGIPLSTLGPTSLIKNFNVQLPAGQYTLTSLQSALQTQMDVRSEAVGFALNYTVSISPDNGKITWGISGTTGYSGQINFLGGTTANMILGLPPQNPTPNPSYSTPFTSVISYTAPNLINISGPKEIHIRCPNFLSNVFETRVQTDSTILAVIPVVASQFATLCYIPAVPKVFAYLGTRFEQLSFEITDENGFVLDLNNFGVTIQLAVYHEKQESGNSFLEMRRMLRALQGFSLKRK